MARMIQSMSMLTNMKDSLKHDTQSVLRCGQCNKPFDKESALKRHGYYCRSRRTGTSPRVRSCDYCAKRKARCDNRRPQCSRCMTKAIDCHYPAETSRGAESKTQYGDDAPTDWQETTASSLVDSHGIANPSEANDGDDVSLGNALVTSEPAFADLGAGFFGMEVPELDFADFMNPEVSKGTTHYLSPPSLSSTRDPVPVICHPSEIQQVISSPKLSVPRLPTYTTRSLIQRERLQTASQKSANLMLHTLVSYPRMMLRHKTLPPFMHPRLVSFDEGNDDMEPLNNCIGLVNMISSGTRGVRKLFWRNVRQECTRFCDEHLIYNKWELLAAMQALSVYILIRLDEGATDHNNFDLLLLTTVMVIAGQLNRSDIAHGTESSALSDYSLEGSWKEWIFEESLRRLCVVYQSVNLLVYFEPAAMCDRPVDLILAPLPSSKHLWEASDELTWAAGMESQPDNQTVFALAANGELVNMDKDQIHCHDGAMLLNSKTPLRRTADWGEWYSEMDGFGGLVMLAASLVS